MCPAMPLGWMGWNAFEGIIVYASFNSGAQVGLNVL